MFHDVRSITFRRYGPEDARKMVDLQHRYLEAYDAAFENESNPLERLQHFMGWSGWSQGTTLRQRTADTAFEGDPAVGSVTAIYEPDPQQNVERAGATEYVFVRPEWRRRGPARYLVARSMQYLKERGLRYARMVPCSLSTLLCNPSCWASPVSARRACSTRSSPSWAFA